MNASSDSQYPKRCNWLTAPSRGAASWRFSARSTTLEILGPRNWRSICGRCRQRQWRSLSSMWQELNTWQDFCQWILDFYTRWLQILPWLLFKLFSNFYLIIWQSSLTGLYFTCPPEAVHIKIKTSLFDVIDKHTGINWWKVHTSAFAAKSAEASIFPCQKCSRWNIG